MAAVVTAMTYKLLYARLDPASEEQICVGVVVREGERRTRVVFDRSLRKLRCVAPEADVEALRFYLDALAQEFERGTEEGEALLRYSHTIVASSDRRIVAPLDDDVLAVLIGRFVSRGEDVQEHAAVRIDARQATQERVATFAESLLTTRRLIRRARPRDVVGSPVKGIERVAAAVHLPSSVVILDGVDLQNSSYKVGVKEADRVGRIFWRYGRLERTLFPRRVRRIGVIFNGRSANHGEHEDEYREAYLYAHERLRRDADLAINADSSDDRQQLAAELSEA